MLLYRRACETFSAQDIITTLNETTERTWLTSDAENARREKLISCRMLSNRTKPTPLSLTLISIRISQFLLNTKFNRIPLKSRRWDHLIQANRFNYNKNNKHLSAVGWKMKKSLFTFIEKCEKWIENICSYQSIFIIIFVLRRNEKEWTETVWRGIIILKEFINVSNFLFQLNIVQK